MLDDGLTVLSFGAGQDSTAILYKLIHDEEFRKRFVRGHLIVVMSDTGNEHPQTYQHIVSTNDLCNKTHHIEFYFLHKSQGLHGRTWQSLKERYRLNNCVGSKAYPKSCTANLKINVIYKFINNYIAAAKGYSNDRKDAIKTFAQDFGNIRVMIGFARGEEGRVADKANDPVWMRESVERIYPLLDIGYDRGDCQEFIKQLGYEVPLPSNCMLCPYMSEQELVYLYRYHQSEYEEWIELERNKIEKFKYMGDKNYGVWGKKLLPEVLEGALKKFGHWTDAELQEYKMSHGHCVKSKY